VVAGTGAGAGGGAHRHLYGRARRETTGREQVRKGTELQRGKRNVRGERCLDQWRRSAARRQEGRWVWSAVGEEAKNGDARRRDATPLSPL
jgi:hypothetical protein